MQPPHETARTFTRLERFGQVLVTGVLTAVFAVIAMTIGTIVDGPTPEMVAAQKARLAAIMGRITVGASPQQVSDAVGSLATVTVETNAHRRTWLRVTRPVRRSIEEIGSGRIGETESCSYSVPLDEDLRVAGPADLDCIVWCPTGAPTLL